MSCPVTSTSKACHVLTLLAVCILCLTLSVGVLTSVTMFPDTLCLLLLLLCEYQKGKRERNVLLIIQTYITCILLYIIYYMIPLYYNIKLHTSWRSQYSNTIYNSIIIVSDLQDVCSDYMSTESFCVDPSRNLQLDTKIFPPTKSLLGLS